MQLLALYLKYSAKLNQNHTFIIYKSQKYTPVRA